MLMIMTSSLPILCDVLVASVSDPSHLVDNRPNIHYTVSQIIGWGLSPHLYCEGNITKFSESLKSLFPCCYGKLIVIKQNVKLFLHLPFVCGVGGILFESIEAASV